MNIADINFLILRNGLITTSETTINIDDVSFSNTSGNDACDVGLTSTSYVLSTFGVDSAIVDCNATTFHSGTKSVELTSAAGGISQSWGIGGKLQLDSNIDISSANTVRYWVWSNQAVAMDVKLELVDGVGGIWTQNTNVVSLSAGNGVWTEVVAALDTTINLNDINSISILILRNSAVTSSATTVYVDDIAFSNENSLDACDIGLSSSNYGLSTFGEDSFMFDCDTAVVHGGTKSVELSSANSGITTSWGIGGMVDLDSPIDLSANNTVRYWVRSNQAVAMDVKIELVDGNNTIWSQVTDIVSLSEIDGVWTEVAVSLGTNIDLTNVTAINFLILRNTATTNTATTIYVDDISFTHETNVDSCDVGLSSSSYSLLTFGNDSFSFDCDSTTFRSGSGGVTLKSAPTGIQSGFGIGGSLQLQSNLDISAFNTVHYWVKSNENSDMTIGIELLDSFGTTWSQTAELFSLTEINGIWTEVIVNIDTSIDLSNITEIHFLIRRNSLLTGIQTIVNIDDISFANDYVYPDVFEQTLPTGNASYSIYTSGEENLTYRKEISDKLTGSSALEFTADSGLTNWGAGAFTKFDTSQDASSLTKIRYSIKSLTNVANVDIALELFLGHDGFNDSSWVQTASIVSLQDVYNQPYQEIVLPMNLENFERTSPNDGSLFEHSHVKEIGILLLIQNLGTQVTEKCSILVDKIEFTDVDVLLQVSSNIPAQLPPTPVDTLISEFTGGTSSRLGIYVADQNSEWLHLAHALKNFGVPVKLHTVLSTAINHDVLMVYPEISSVILSSSDISTLTTYVNEGGTLLGIQVQDAMQAVFGINDYYAMTDLPFSDIREAKLNINVPEITSEFTDEREKRINLWDNGSSVLFPSYGYDVSTLGSETIMAIYDNLLDGDDIGNKAAIIKNTSGLGQTFAFGWDLGQFARRGYRRGMGRDYINAYDPSVDTFYRIVKNIYEEHEVNAVTIWPVADNKDVNILYTHDIDAQSSNVNARDFGDLELNQGTKGTYFWQTKYLTDERDQKFFNQDAIDSINILQGQGMEIGSHSVAHSFTFAVFDLGTGDSQFPGYQPFNAEDLTEPSGFRTDGGTVLGEMRISKFLLEHFLSNYTVRSFRPGHLLYPVRLNESLQATGFEFESTTTAADTMTHIPHLTFALAAGSVRDLLDIVEIPITWEDELKNPMNAPQFMVESRDIVKRIAPYGGTFNVLIHPNILDHKLEYQRELTEFFDPGNELDYIVPHYVTMSELGQWWLARNYVDLDVSINGIEATLHIETRDAIDGLTINVGSSWTLNDIDPNLTQTGSRLVIGSLTSGQILDIHFYTN